MALRRVVRVLRLAAQRVQQETGISAAQTFVLEELRDGNPLSLNELAVRTLTDRTSVAEVVMRLQERKLVHRVADPSDRRRAAITATPTGRALLRRIPVRSGAPVLTALATLDGDDLAQLAHGLTRLARALHAPTGRAPFVFGDDAPPERSGQDRASSARVNLPQSPARDRR